ncbi:MAG: hypothetical protein KJ737_25580 [Proteobacteria bacterium]|nr:hypothetical protein [Pseudomonadota bacterium]
MSEGKSFPHLAWGIVLTMTGLMMFFSIPGKMQDIQAIKQYSSGMNVFLRVSFYLISILLTGGGLKKVFTHFKSGRED